jgi:hypothetical protein
VADLGNRAGAVAHLRLGPKTPVRKIKNMPSETVNVLTSKCAPSGVS